MSGFLAVVVYVAGLVVTSVIGSAVTTATVGESIAFIVFWPLTASLWLLLNLWRLLRTFAREVRA